MIPAHIDTWLEDNGYQQPYKHMGKYIALWHEWMLKEGSFYSLQHRGNDRVYVTAHRGVNPAKRIANEWASLLMNEDLTVNTDNEAANKWLSGYLKGKNGFIAKAQAMVARAFALGTGALAMWYATDSQGTTFKVRSYDARMVVPLAYDDDEVTECAFVSQAIVEGKTVDQLQLHVLDGGTYHIKTYLWYKGKPFTSDIVLPDFDSLSPSPTFAVIRPAIDNTAVDYSPYGMSIYADAVDALAAVETAFDALVTEIQRSKMRVFMSDLLFDTRQGKDGDVQYIPFGQDDAEIYRLQSMDGSLIETFAPQLRSDSMLAVYRAFWQTLGDLCGFGSDYFDVTRSGGIRTATEVSADNSQLMRNIHKHENALQKPLQSIFIALLNAAVHFDGQPSSLLEVGDITIAFDDSIITDTQSEKLQGLREVAAGILGPEEYRAKWYGETDNEAAANVPDTVTAAGGFA